MNLSKQPYNPTDARTRVQNADASASPRKPIDWNRRIAALSCALMLAASGCIPATDSEQAAGAAAGDSPAQAAQATPGNDAFSAPGNFALSDSTAAIATQAAPAKADISDRDRDGTWDDASAVHVALSGATAQIDSVGATVSEGVLTITRAGTYVLSGTLNGRIVVTATSDDKIQLVLNSVSVISPDGPALTVTQADKVFLTVAADTSNALSDSAAYTELDSDNEPDACIFSKDDLTVNGAGKLAVTGNWRHGIVCKDSLVIVDADVDVTAASDGLKGTDAVFLGGSATVSVTAANDAIYTKGTFVQESGAAMLSAGDDGVHADVNLTISGGTLTVTQSAEGLESLMLCITDGDVSITASDDGLNAAASTNASEAGTAGGQAAAESAQTQAGDAERQAVPIDTQPPTDTDTRPSWGGAFDEQPGGRGGNPVGGGRGGADAFAAVEGALISISGGTLTIDASGDALDSNGDLLISGGTIVIHGPVSGMDGAIDYNGGAAITGGTFLASGAAGMQAVFGASSTQATLLFTAESSLAAGLEVTLADASGTILARFTPVKDWQCILLSVPELVDGQTYTLSAGGAVLDTVTLSGLITNAGANVQANTNGRGKHPDGQPGMPGGSGFDVPPEPETTGTDAANETAE